MIWIRLLSCVYPLYIWNRYHKANRYHDASILLRNTLHLLLFLGRCIWYTRISLALSFCGVLASFMPLILYLLCVSFRVILPSTTYNNIIVDTLLRSCSSSVSSRTIRRCQASPSRIPNINPYSCNTSPDWGLIFAILPLLYSYDVLFLCYTLLTLTVAILFSLLSFSIT